MVRYLLVAIAIITCAPSLAQEEHGDFHISLHHRVVEREAEELRGHHGCIQLNRGFAARDIVGAIPICLGPEMADDTTDALHFSVGAKLRHEIVGAGPNWWTHVGLGFTGGFSFVTEMQIAFDIEAEGSGDAGLENPISDATIDQLPENLNFLRGDGEFDGRARGDSSFAFGFGVQLGTYLQLGPFSFEGGVRYDYIHRRWPAGYFEIGARLPRIRDSD